MRQMTLFFDDATTRPKRDTASKDEIFHDYESFVKKFSANEKTTDDTYTPQDVYEAVVAYVDTIYPLKGKKILRPFFPGGDYAGSAQHRVPLLNGRKCHVLPGVEKPRSCEA